jgi:membrane fusion protein, copper/silver efflux system
MKKSIWTFVTCSLVAAASAGFWYSQHTPASAEALAGRKVLHYIDPMHPTYTSPNPGIAPDCGMALEPVYADASPGTVAGSAGHGSHVHGEPAPVVKASAAQQRLMGVRVAAAERTSGARSIRVSGRVAAEEHRVYKVTVGIPAYLREVAPITTGSQVRKDQWLATFSSPDVRQPVQAYLVSLDVVDRAERNKEPSAQSGIAMAGVQQNIDRLLTMGMSPVQIEEIRRKRLVPPNVAITSPASGFVVARNVSAGQTIHPDTELYHIADLNKVWIDADAFGLEAHALRAVVAADVRFPGGQTAIRARVTDALPVFDPATQALKLRLEADNPDYLLRPDMLVDVDLQVPTTPAITVPRDAVVQTGLEAIVFVDRGEGGFEPRRVQTGWRSGDRIEVVQGLEPGERVAISGTFLLDSDRRMRLASAERGAGR